MSSSWPSKRRTSMCVTYFAAARTCVFDVLLLLRSNSNGCWPISFIRSYSYRFEHFLCVTALPRHAFYFVRNSLVALLEALCVQPLGLHLNTHVAVFVYACVYTHKEWRACPAHTNLNIETLDPRNVMILSIWVNTTKQTIHANNLS